MFELILKKMKRKAGFTLIELIVVIAILGILAVIAIPKFGAVRTDAQTTALEADVRVIEGAAAVYQAKYGAWPGNVSVLSPYLEASVVSKYNGGTFNADGKFTPPAH